MSISDTDIDGRIGARVRALRAERGLTLDALAQQADVSRAMLSRIERGESSPTAQLLNKICGGLGVSLSHLFTQAQAASPLARVAEQPCWRDPATGYLRRAVSPAGSTAPFEIVAVDFPPHGRVSFDNQGLAAIEQQIWVQAGTLDLALGESHFRLNAGDCLAMRLDRPITFANPTDQPLRYVVVIGRGGHRS